VFFDENGKADFIVTEGEDSHKETLSSSFDFILHLYLVPASWRKLQ
jgi:hypothetical protein